MVQGLLYFAKQIDYCSEAFAETYAGPNVAFPFFAFYSLSS